MRTYTLFWDKGKTELVKGDNIREAFISAGYDVSSMVRLQKYEIGDVRTDYFWNDLDNIWEFNYN